MFNTSRLPLNVLHQLEVRSLGLYLLHGPGADLVDQITQHDAVLELVFVRYVGRQRLAQYLTDPF